MKSAAQFVACLFIAGSMTSCVNNNNNLPPKATPFYSSSNWEIDKADLSRTGCRPDTIHLPLSFAGAQNISQTGGPLRSVPIIAGNYAVFAATFFGGNPVEKRTTIYANRLDNFNNAWTHEVLGDIGNNLIAINDFICFGVKQRDSLVFYAIKSADHSLVWRTAIGRNMYGLIFDDITEFVASPVAASGKVYFVTGKKESSSHADDRCTVFMLNALTGQFLEKTSLGLSEDIANPVYAFGKLFLSKGNRLMILDDVTLGLEHSVTLPTQKIDALSFQYNVGVGNKALLLTSFRTNNGGDSVVTVRAYDYELNEMWSQNIVVPFQINHFDQVFSKYEFMNDFTLCGDKIIHCFGNKLTCFNDVGSILWQTDIGTGFYQSHIVCDKQNIFVAKDTLDRSLGFSGYPPTLMAINVSNGAETVASTYRFGGLGRSLSLIKDGVLVFDGTRVFLLKHN